MKRNYSLRKSHKSNKVLKVEERNKTVRYVSSLIALVSITYILQENANSIIHGYFTHEILMLVIPLIFYSFFMPKEKQNM